MSGEGILDSVLNMNCIVSCKKTTKIVNKLACMLVAIYACASMRSLVEVHTIYL